MQHKLLYRTTRAENPTEPGKITVPKMMKLMRTSVTYRRKTKKNLFSEKQADNENPKDHGEK